MTMDSDLENLNLGILGTFVPKDEIYSRQKKFISLVDQSIPEWNCIVIFGRINQFYLTGTIQDSVLVFKRESRDSSYSCRFYVRKSHERAVRESSIDCIYKMESYKDIREYIGEIVENIYSDLDYVSLSTFDRFKKSVWGMTQISPWSCDKVLMILRAVKSEYEIELLQVCGKLHNNLFKRYVPEYISYGISEAEFGASLFKEMVKIGYQGISRFSASSPEMVVGQIAFGTNSIEPTSFDGPGGMVGNSFAAPVLGSFERKLDYNELLFVDIAFGFLGYHTDKTQLYFFGSKDKLSYEVRRSHDFCNKLLEKIASELRVGAIPSEIYKNALSHVNGDFVENFMGFGSRKVKFLGHGIGLFVDELPVLSENCHIPLEKGMVIAVEPKRGVEGFGITGVEETFLITDGGPVCLTGGASDIICV